jgi:voltage-gated sodium channel
VKLFKKIPQLQMIVMGLAGGIKSIGYIVILLLLVFYLYAIVGITVFRTNDPWHYRDLQTTMLTLFRASTLEDWTDIMYISIFGCDKYNSGIYVTPESFTPDNRMEWCMTPEQNQFLSPFFWVTFVVVSALVMLSLFIGAVTMSMTESMEQMKEEEEEASKKRMKEKQMAKMRAAQEANIARRNSELMAEMNLEDSPKKKAGGEE